MALTVRKKRFIRRLMGYATNPVTVKYRVMRDQEQTHTVGDIVLTLPPEHNLPFYQHRDPTYDAYAIDKLAALARGERRVTVIDVGANVGDTAAAILSSHTSTQVISVEGDPRFVSYLQRNIGPFSDRATIVDGFVGPVDRPVAFHRVGSTARFVAADGDAPEPEWVTPARLLSMCDADDLVVWKSDIDGLDFHVLANHWQAIEARSDAIWFEFDPPGMLGDPSDLNRLIALLGTSNRTVEVYDNLGRKMTVLPPGHTAGLRALAHWLYEQRHGHVMVPYLDIWALTPDAATLMGCASI